MDESTSIEAETRTHLSAMSTKQLLCLKRLILEADKPFVLPPEEEMQVQLIKDEIISRAVEPVREVIARSPHTDKQILGGAIVIAASVIIGVIPGMWWLHAILTTAICCWLAWHWQFLFPGKVAA